MKLQHRVATIICILTITILACSENRLPDECPPNCEDLSFLNNDLTNVDMSDQDFAGAEIRGAIWIWVDASNANFSNATLSFSDFQTCTFTGANFTNAKLAGVNFIGVDLRNANFTNADIGTGKFQGADLRGANFTGTNLNGVKLNAAQYDDTTIWPEGYKVPKLFGPIKTEPETEN